MEFATYGDMKNVITKLDDTEINGRRIRIIEQKPRGRRQRYSMYADCRQWLSSMCVLLCESEVKNAQ